MTVSVSHIFLEDFWPAITKFIELWASVYAQLSKDPERLDLNGSRSLEVCSDATLQTQAMLPCSF